VIFAYPEACPDFVYTSGVGPTMEMFVAQILEDVDEDGNEYSLLPTEDLTIDLERVKFKYVAKQLRGDEKSPISLDSSSIRFSCISQDLFKIDYLKNKIVKGDEFYTFDGTKYSIDRVNHVGQMQNMEFLLELECSRV
jgi:hypothetical protein